MDQITITPTTSCNITCNHCGEDERIKGKDMSQPILEDLLEAIKESDIEVITISGGEVISPQYKDTLLDAIKKTKIGETKDINIQTNGWWGNTEETCQEMLSQLDECNVSTISLSTDFFHTRFISEDSIVRIIKSLENSPIDLHTVDVRSFKSTYGFDLDLIQRISEKLNKDISRTTVTYTATDAVKEPFIKKEEKKSILPRYRQPIEAKGFQKFTNFFQPYMNMRTSDVKGFYNVVQNDDDFEKLKHIRNIIYSVGDNSGYNVFMANYEGINFTQSWAQRVGCAKQHIKKEDEIVQYLPGIFKYMVGKDGKKIHYNTRAILPTVMPDGSLIPDCSFGMLNNYKRARIGKFPLMSLKNFERACNSELFSCAKAYVDLHTYVPSLGIDLARKLSK